MTEPEKTDFEGYEVDQLRYRGMTVPWFIKAGWAIIIVASIYYFLTYGYPDLEEWLIKLKS